MNMNQWIDFDSGDEAQSDYGFTHKGKAYCIELTLSVGYGDIWFANLFTFEGVEKLCMSAIKIPTCGSEELVWLKQYLTKRMDMLLLELESQVPFISFELEDIIGFSISSVEKSKLLDKLHVLWVNAYQEAT